MKFLNFLLASLLLFGISEAVTLSFDYSSPIAYKLDTLFHIDTRLGIETVNMKGKMELDFVITPLSNSSISLKFKKIIFKMNLFGSAGKKSLSYNSTKKKNPKELAMFSKLFQSQLQFSRDENGKFEETTGVFLTLKEDSSSLDPLLMIFNLKDFIGQLFELEEQDLELNGQYPVPHEIPYEVKGQVDDQYTITQVGEDTIEATRKSEGELTSAGYQIQTTSREQIKWNRQNAFIQERTSSASADANTSTVKGHFQMFLKWKQTVRPKIQQVAVKTP